MRTLIQQAAAQRARLLSFWKIRAAFGTEFVLLAEAGKAGQVRDIHRAGDQMYCNYGNGNFGVLKLYPDGSTSDAGYSWAPLTSGAVSDGLRTGGPAHVG